MKVKLMTGLSYRRQGMFFQRDEVVDVEDGLGASLLRTKRFEEVTEIAEEPAPAEPAKEPAAEEPAAEERGSAPQGDAADQDKDEAVHV